MRRSICLAIAGAALIALSGCQSTTKQIAVTQTPIVIKAQETTKPIAFKKVVSKLPRSKEIGKIGVGILCLPAGSFVGRGRRSPMDTERFNDIFREELLAYNYEVVGDPDKLFGDPDLSKAEYFVAGLIVDAETNGCFPMAGFGDLSNGSGAAFLEVQWQIFDTFRREVILTVETNGSGNIESGVDPIGLAIEEAFASAVGNLLADRDFYELMRKSGGSEEQKNFLDGALALTFNSDPGVNYNEMRYSVATIRSPGGLGSGFLIDKNVFLTNEHVVGTADVVRVVMEGGLQVEGRVTARDPVWDVATVEVSIEGKPLSIGTTTPAVGANVYSIGTPLDEKLAGTMRKGIVSAMRDYRNLSYIQADVALNPGNSGGPLLDEQGNVVGVAVSGVMIGGGQQDLNFFIPIEEALSAIVKTDPQS